VGLIVVRFVRMPVAGLAHLPAVSTVGVVAAAFARVIVVRTVTTVVQRPAMQPVI
jgi:hypothetical protein